MKFCLNCNEELEDDAIVCDNCGANQEEEAKESTEILIEENEECEETDEEDYEKDDDNNNDDEEEKDESPIYFSDGRGFGVAGLVLGTVGLVFCLILPPVAIAPCILGIIFSAISMGKAKKLYTINSMAIAGLVCSIVALAISTVMLIILLAGIIAGINILNSPDLTNALSELISF